MSSTRDRRTARHRPVAAVGDRSGRVVRPSGGGSVGGEGMRTTGRTSSSTTNVCSFAARIGHRACAVGRSPLPRGVIHPHRCRFPLGSHRPGHALAARRHTAEGRGDSPSGGPGDSFGWRVQEGRRLGVGQRVEPEQCLDQRGGPHHPVRFAFGGEQRQHGPSHPAVARGQLTGTDGAPGVVRTSSTNASPSSAGQRRRGPRWRVR